MGSEGSEGDVDLDGKRLESHKRVASSPAARMRNGDGELRNAGIGSHAIVISAQTAGRCAVDTWWC